MTWFVHEKLEDLNQIGIFESLFTIANGYMGLRGILEEKPQHAGTYIAGIYSKIGEEPKEIVNLPNPLGLNIEIDGVNIRELTPLAHTRKLNMKHAILERETVFDGIKLKSKRFVSFANPHLGFHKMKLEFDEKRKIRVERFIDCNTKNRQRIVGGEAKHYTILEKTFKRRKVGVEVKAGNHKVALALGINRNAKFLDEQGKVGFLIETKAKRLEITTPFVCFTSRETRSPLKSCFEQMKWEYKGELKAHKKAIEKIWDVCDIKVNNEQIQYALRFNLYHLIIASPRMDLDVSIPARTLSGEWYGGHIFWDTEIFALPFYIFTLPEVAKRLLLYRYRRLKQAKERAKSLGYKGALWPWESADTGEDETPKLILTEDGYVPVYTAEMQHHITGDIAYATYNYYAATGDKKFWYNYGIKMITEAARFWVSRAKPRGKNFVIQCVIGPDEFHVGVDNNAYTNFLAKWNLLLAYEIYKRYRHIKKIKQLGISRIEAKKWIKIASSLVIPRRGDIVEQFEGYSKLEDIEKADYVDDISKTKVIKQADVILLFHLFPNHFTSEEMRKNLEYYEPKTIHMSSLSLPSYAFAALNVGDIKKAWGYFIKVLYSDLKNIYGNTDKGVHLAAAGGVWQLVVNGFAGIRAYEEYLEINPKLPEFLHKLEMKIWYKGNLLNIKIAGKKISVRPIVYKKAINLLIQGKKIKIKKEGIKNHFQDSTIM